MERSYYRNDTPLGFWQALCVLHRSFGDATLRMLRVDPEQGPRIDIEHYTGPYDSLSCTTRFRVTPAAAAELARRALVTGEPHWGGRSTWEFVVTERLEEAYSETIAPKYEANVW